MRTIAFVAVVALVAGCSRAHIRNYDVPKEALVVVQDEHGTETPLEPGDSYLATSQGQAVLVIEDVRQTRYPLDKGWKLFRDRDCLTIETIDTFKPY